MGNDRMQNVRQWWIIDNDEWQISDNGEWHIEGWQTMENDIYWRMTDNGEWHILRDDRQWRMRQSGMIQENYNGEWQLMGNENGEYLGMTDNGERDNGE